LVILKLQQVLVMIYNKLQILHVKWLHVMECQILVQLHLEDDNNEQMFLGGESNDAIADRIDTEVCKIINHCEQIATEIILDNRVIIDLVVEKLLDAETIDGSEFRIHNFT
jgi:ATP-dependent Zn protease